MYAFTGGEFPKRRENPYMFYMHEYTSGSYTPEGLGLNIDNLQNTRKKLISLAYTKSHATAKKISPIDPDAATDKVLTDIEAWEKVKKSAEKLKKVDTPEELLAALGQALQHAKQYPRSGVDMTELAARYFGLNFGDYFAVGWVAGFTGKENPYASLFRLCKIGLNVLDFTKVGSEIKLVVQCPTYQDGKPAWGIYVQGEGEIKRYSAWTDQVVRPARRLDESTALPEIKMPDPVFYG